MNNIELLICAYTEVFFMISGGLGLIGIRPKLSKITVLAGILAVIVVGIRNFYIMNNIPFGTHSFLLIVFMILVLHKVGRQSLMDSAVATLTSFLLLFWGEGVFLYPILRFLQLDPLTMSGKPGMMFIAVLASDVLLIITFICCYLFKITLIDFKKFHNVEKM